MDKARTLIDLTEDDYAGKLCFGIVWDGGMEDEDTHLIAMLGGHILMIFLYQHCDVVECSELIFGLSLSRISNRCFVQNG